ncbi:alkaline phosphatase family protein [Samsonia erythrinae]|uniref:Putative AlkP superfamily pyrophosphatase or phosphodiesterase n=1 Tax=Samsonia erythrinae TaxID=160434 RepID=A0A4R3VNL3_9GAMM|nr:alkaline phosphatase family protein [Samsonia erythrinae]TCV04735.1 putative AlkP superfamily pyrophosphatase or phosphodiesterase [Samsonia erythrinae]
MRRAVLVILDGLRRDLISEENTPHLYAFARRAEQFNAHHTVFPSCTRVVSASIATGCWPARHGMAGNTMVLTENGRLVRHDAGKPDFLQHKRNVTGRSLHVPTMAEYLADEGGVVIFSNVSPGAAYAHDPDGFGHIYHRAGSFGPGRQPVPSREVLSISLDIQGESVMTDRFIERVVTASDCPAVGVLWMGEPDASQHHFPLGSPEHLAILHHADSHAGRVIAAVEAMADRQEILLLVGSDHGHQTVDEVIDVEAELVSAGLKNSMDSDDVVVASNGTSVLIYLHPDMVSRKRKIECFLRNCAWAGQVFSRGEFESVGIPLEAGPEFAVSMHSTDAKNAYGVAGKGFTARRAGDKADILGAGQHGGMGTFEQMPFLMVAGQGFTPDSERTSPSCVIDIAPTIFTHLGKPLPSFDGQALQHKSCEE